MNEREAADTNAKIERLMDTIAEQQATIKELRRELAGVRNDLAELIIERRRAERYRHLLPTR